MQFDVLGAFLIAESILRGAALSISAEVSADKATVQFKDCYDCPVMVTLPAGQFFMGPTEDEEAKERVPKDWMGYASGRRKRIISYSFAVSIYPVTRKEFRAFAVSTQFVPDSGCVNFDGAGWHQQSRWTWAKTSFAQTDHHPVVCVSWFDARRYIAWLNDRTNGGYRLLTEIEWEYAARATSSARRYWGDDAHHGAQCEFANGADMSYLKDYPTDKAANKACADGYVHTSPVGTFKPNVFGLYDMLGNVNQWVDDCGKNDRGSAQECEVRILRGGAWSDPSWALRAADRYRDLPTTRCMGIGFRVAKTLR